MSYLVSFCSCLPSPFSIAITSLGGERANLSAFRTFVKFMLVWICRFPLPLGVWEELWFVIVELPGLFSYLFFKYAQVQLSSSMHKQNCVFKYAQAKLSSSMHKQNCLRVCTSKTVFEYAQAKLSSSMHKQNCLRVCTNKTVLKYVQAKLSSSMHKQNCLRV